MVRGRIQLAGFAASALALAVLASPAQAQFGGILRGAASGAASSSSGSTSDGCGEGRSRSNGSRVAGGILGGIASSVAGSAGGFVSYVPVSAFTDVISASIACKLDPQEQEQAADATVEATRGADDLTPPEVGQMSEWTSKTRHEVTGTSTVTARDDARDDGLQCITVSDVIIVGGEETRADKRMCRRPPAARYAIAA
jgi:surface antigen